MATTPCLFTRGSNARTQLSWTYIYKDGAESEVRCDRFNLNTVGLPVLESSGVPRNFVRGGGGSTNSVEDRGQRERGSGYGSPLVRGSGGSCNLVQEISFHIVKFP
jgi:hypothetical protein